MAESAAQESTVGKYRRKKKEPPASQKALETVQVGESQEKRDNWIDENQGWCLRQPLKEVMDGRETLRLRLEDEKGLWKIRGTQ